MVKAPDFNLPDQDGKQHTLTDYRGQWVVLYFYPKDSTPGCTTEACSFRDQRDEIAQLGGAVVIGVSTDSVASHKKFATNNHLNFTLLSDPGHQTISAYSSWKSRRFLSKEFMGTERNTFIINPEGEIVKRYLGVDPKSHSQEIINDLKLLQSALA